MIETKKCPRCESPDPARHPAMQFEGEVQVCPDPFHLPLCEHGHNRAHHVRLKCCEGHYSTCPGPKR